MAEAGQIPAATLEMINVRAAAQYAEWKAGATEAQKASGLEKLQKFKNDEAFRNEHMAKMAKAWSDADANGDGKLDLAEYRNYDAAMRTLKEAEGEWHESDHAEENYNIVNSISEGEGFTMEQMRSIMAPWIAKFEELKAADGL